MLVYFQLNLSYDYIDQDDVTIYLIGYRIYVIGKPKKFNLLFLQWIMKNLVSFSCEVFKQESVFG